MNEIEKVLAQMYAESSCDMDRQFFYDRMKHIAEERIATQRFIEALNAQDQDHCR